MYSRSRAFEDYRQTNILTAPPERLLILLFEALLTNVRQARSAIEEGDAATRRECLRKARDIVMELMESLDYSIGGDIAINIYRLYTYVNTCLVRADARAKVHFLDDALRVLDIMDDMWRQAVDNVTRERAAAAAT